MVCKLVLPALLALGYLVVENQSTVYLKEDFNDGKLDSRWVKSTWKPEAEIGAFISTPGEWYADKTDLGMKTSQDARFYGISTKLSAPLTNEGKPLSISYVVKHEQDLDCGGAYIKLLPEPMDQLKFGGDSPYAIMFGPDICGATKKTHAILNYKRPKADKATNMDHVGDITAEKDQKAHLYTFVIQPDNTYQVKIDGKIVQEGKMLENWKYQPEKMIPDPAEKKPADWVDEKQIADPADKKPAGYDDTPKQIPDPKAKQPEDWDTEDDGEWEAPMIDNPEYKGEWKPKMIDNPAYKGEWVHPKIANPDYFEEKKAHAICKNCNYLGIELWQVKSGTLFDDLFVTDDLEEAKKEETRVLAKINLINEEKEKKDKAEEEKRAAEEAKRKEEEDAKKKADEAAPKKPAKEEKKEDDEDEDEDDEEPKKPEKDEL